MSRIETVFAEPGHKALIAYVTVGYPDVGSTLRIVPVLAEAGCDIVELGIPFSDPLADGTTIQEASSLALAAGVTPDTCLEVAGQLRQQVQLPLLFMTYYNPVLRHGLEAFCADCAAAGVDGLIVPDLPPDEAGDLDDATRQHDLDLVYLLAPSSPIERIRLVVREARGFIYLVSLLGVTGARAGLPEGFEEFVARVRRETDKPLCVGFGIAGPETAWRVARVADGAIVGSRLLQVIREDSPPYDGVRSFVRGLRFALDS
jgi:tryptophan synthase alpha chain